MVGFEEEIRLKESEIKNLEQIRFDAYRQCEHRSEEIIAGNLTICNLEILCYKCSYGIEGDEPLGDCIIKSCPRITFSAEWR